MGFAIVQENGTVLDGDKRRTFGKRRESARKRFFFKIAFMQVTSKNAIYQRK